MLFKLKYTIDEYIPYLHFYFIPIVSIVKRKVFETDLKDILNINYKKNFVTKIKKYVLYKFDNKINNDFFIKNTLKLIIK